MRKILKTRKRHNKDSDAEEKLINIPDQFKDFAAGAYKELLEHRSILINGDIEEDSIERVVIQIQKMSTNKPKEPITILINSVGGFVYEAQAIIDTMQQTKTPITTVALGKVMSAAFAIYLAGDYRVCGRNSIFMAHNGSDDLGEVKMVDGINEAKFNERLLDSFARYYASRTNVSHKEWLEIFNSNKDHYFFADEAKKMGIVHDISEPQISKYKPKFSKKSKKSKKIAKSRGSGNRKKKKKK